ncbi:hypothetical protein F8M41_023884 [Gigaspora margarita]|uniref:Zn(2)-C6 fungal-type domain-containing protein n=2 Tax=Gigaspora margarita TaxID=4874 RepID=A0A8H4ACL5_GIGMA|nr:hypothetical protein F8M41_023884 [Gigaspora margarita]
MTSTRRKKYIVGRACTNCKLKKHKCDDEGIQCKYCAKRNLKCVRGDWDKRGRKPNQPSSIHNDKGSFDSFIYEQMQPESNECILHNNETQQFYPNFGFTPFELHEPTFGIDDLDKYVESLCLLQIRGHFNAEEGQQTYE